MVAGGRISEEIQRGVSAALPGERLLALEQLPPHHLGYFVFDRSDGVVFAGDGPIVGVEGVLKRRVQSDVAVRHAGDGLRLAQQAGLGERQVIDLARAGEGGLVREPQKGVLNRRRPGVVGQ